MSSSSNQNGLPAPLLRNRTIRGVAENTAMQVEMELFERGVKENDEFYVSVLRWERQYAAASQYLQAERLRAAIQRILYRQPLPPIGPPLIAADIFPTAAGASPPARAAPVHMAARSNQAAPPQTPSSNRNGILPTVVDPSPARAASVPMPARHNQASAVALELGRLALGGNSEGSSQLRSADRGGGADRRGTGSVSKCTK